MLFCLVVASSTFALVLAQTCTSGQGTNNLYTSCTFPVGSSSFTKPVGVALLNYELSGGQGGQQQLYTTYSGSSASVIGTLNFAAEARQEVTLSVIVGAAGGDVTSGSGAAAVLGGSGYGNGGNGGTYYGLNRAPVAGRQAAAGGGSSAISLSSSSTLLLVAGGGGGASVLSTSSGTGPGPTSLSTTNSFPINANGQNGLTGQASVPGILPEAEASGGSGGGDNGGGGVSTAQQRGGFGTSYYNSAYHVFAPTLSSTTAVNTGTTPSGNARITYLTPIAPSSANGRQRARRLRRRNMCAVGFAMCNQYSKLCVNLKTSLEHCGTCHNDCADLGDRTKCVEGVCEQIA